MISSDRKTDDIVRCLLSYSHGRIRIGTSPSRFMVDEQAPKKKDQDVQIHPHPRQFSKYLLVSQLSPALVSPRPLDSSPSAVASLADIQVVR